MSGWRLNQPKVTLLASAFFVEWTLPTFTVPPQNTNNKRTSSSLQPSPPPFTPEAEALHFTCEWKAASSLDSTKLEFKGDTTCCLVPIEWAEEDVVMRLSFRFLEPVLLPDGSRAPTSTIFDGERCIVRARRAPANPLLTPQVSSTLKSTEVSGLMEQQNLSGVTCAQVLRAHPGLVDAFSLSLVRRGNDISQLECGPWLGSIDVLMDQINEDDTSSSEDEDGKRSTKKSTTTKEDIFKLPTNTRRYHGCASLNGIKLDVWEVSYKRASSSGKNVSFEQNQQQQIDYSFFTSEHENSISPRHHHRSSNNKNYPSASPTFGNSNASSPQAPLFTDNNNSSSLKSTATFNATNILSGEVVGGDVDASPMTDSSAAVVSPSLNSSPTAKEPTNNNKQKDFDEDIVIFLSAHDGLDEVDTFENRKLTNRLNPLNITKAFFEEWMAKPNVLVCVCGAFSYGQYAVVVAEQLLREFDAKKNPQQHYFYSKPRLVCATFASNPPRLSQADTTGRLKRKDNCIIRSQNHFLHVAPIIEAPVVAPDDLPNVEAAANARRSRSLDFVDYFLGECASFAVGKNFLSIVLESYLERQNSYDQHSTMMTSQGTAEVVNPIMSMASAVSVASGVTSSSLSAGGGSGGGSGSGGGGSSGGVGGSGSGGNTRTAAENELALAAACESPWIRSIVDETASSSGFTPLDVVANIPELVRERSLMQKANIPDNLTSVFSSTTLLNAFESSLQQHLVAATTEETLAEAALRCEPVITSAEIKPTRLRMAELALVIQGTNLQFARHVVLRDSTSSRDAVFARTEVEVPIRERSRGFDGFTCKVHPASLLRFVEEITEEDEYQYSGKDSSKTSSSSMKKKNMFASSEDLLLDDSTVSTQPPTSPTSSSPEEPLSPASRNTTNKQHSSGRKPRTRLVARFDVCVWAENGCAAFVDVIASFPDGLVPWMANSGSWTSKQNHFLSPPVELISSAARLHFWGSFASSSHLQGGAPLAGTDLPRRLLKGLESAALALSVVNPQDKSSNFFSRAFKSAKDKLASDPLTMQNAPQVPTNLKLVGTETLLKDIPMGNANSHAAAASRARILHQQSTETRTLKNYLDPLLVHIPWLASGVEYRAKVLRSAHLLGIPLENSWYQQHHQQASSSSSSSSPTSTRAAKNLNNTVPVIEALLWHHVSSLLQACGAKIQDSITEVTLKSFCETIGFVLLRHESFATKKESDGTAFFADMMMVWAVCIMHELRAFSSGTTLVLVTGDRGAGASSVASLLQNTNSSLRNHSLPHSFTWVIELYPLEDLFGEALLVFPNIALFYVTTLGDCARDSDVMQLSTNTNSLILAQRDGVPPENWNRHHQWIVLNKIDMIVGVENNNLSTGEENNNNNSSTSNGRALMKQRMNFAREEFKKKCCSSLQIWNASEEKNLIPIAVNPQFVQGGAGAQEIAELRMRAVEFLKEAVQRISIW